MNSAPDMTASAGADRHLMLIGGERVDSAGGTIEIIDPATEKPIGSTPAGDADDVDRAVQVAHDAFYRGPWAVSSAKDRARILWRMADLIEEHGEELARLEAGNSGMLLQLARYMVAYSADLFRYYAGWTTKIDGKTANLSGNGRSVHAFTLKAPIGVCAFIVPWNAPISLTCLKLAPALAAGCTCVVKPAEETPLTAFRLAELLRQAGLPDGVVNVVTGYGHIAGAALAAHDKVRKIAFTGSTVVGKRIAIAATGNLKKVTLELGGKSPTIIFDDADMEQAITGAAAAIFTNSGQICFAGSRLYVQRKAFDHVVAGIAAHARKLKIGDPMAEGIDLGPIISARQIGHVMGLIDSAAGDGAELVTGGSRLDRPGYFVEPTLFINPRTDARIVTEEIFGPVLTALPFDDIEEVMQAANDTIYGLAASVWTRDINKANLVAQRFESGCVWINCAFLNDPSMPGGGYKQSGWGREGGKEGLDAYLETKKVFTLLN